MEAGVGGKPFSAVNGVGSIAPADAVPASLPACPALLPGDLWIFAYGSLMWSPEFPFLCAAKGLLRGYRRTFCIYSHRYRGTPQQPGLVLGLDRGGACRGIAYLVAARDVADTLEALWGREMSRLTYQPRLLNVRVQGVVVQALTFVADPRHSSYAGRLSLEQIAARVASCRGARGPNIDYLLNTLRHLDELGMRDERLHRVLLAVEELRRAQSTNDGGLVRHGKI